MIRSTPFAPVVLALVLAFVGACDGGSSPNSPSGTVADPVVTIQVSYRCHPCTNDPDNYAINVDCGNNGCRAYVRAQNPTVEQNTLTYSGRLAPGNHNFEIVVHAVETSVTVTFPTATTADNTGGIKPDSLRLVSSDTSSVDVLRFSRCGLVKG